MVMDLAVAAPQAPTLSKNHSSLDLVVAAPQMPTISPVSITPQSSPSPRTLTPVKCTSEVGVDLVVAAPHMPTLVKNQSSVDLEVAVPQMPRMPNISPVELSPNSSPRSPSATPWGSSWNKYDQYLHQCVGQPTDMGALKVTSEAEFRVQEQLQAWMEHFDRRLDELKGVREVKGKSVLTIEEGYEWPNRFESDDSQISGGIPVEADAEMGVQNLVSGRVSQSSVAASEVFPQWGSPRKSARSSRGSGISGIAEGRQVSNNTSMDGRESARDSGLKNSAVLARRRSVQHRMMELHSQLTSNRLQPKTDGGLRFLQHPCFENFLAFAIIVDGLLIGMEVEYAARSGINDQPVFAIAEAIFFAVFALEVMLRVSVLGLEWARSAWNIFDALLVLIQFSQFVVNLSGGAHWKGIATGRLLRILRVARIARLVRLLRFFSQLLVMVKMIMFSLESLFWLMILLITMMYVVSIIFTQGVTDYKLTEDANSEIVGSLERFFGHMAVSSLSLFKAITNGISWGILSDLLFEVHFGFGFIFVLFVFFVFFSVLNVVTGVFVDGAIRHAGQQREVLVAAERKSLEEICSKLTELLVDIDTDASGTITIDEFIACAKDSKMSSYLCALGIDTLETAQLFAYLDRDQSGEIELQEFIDGCIKLRGGAKSIDLHLLMFALEGEYKKISSLVDATLTEQKSMRRLLLAATHHRDHAAPVHGKSCDLPKLCRTPKEDQVGVPEALFSSEPEVAPRKLDRFVSM